MRGQVKGSSRIVSQLPLSILGGLRSVSSHNTPPPPPPPSFSVDGPHSHWCFMFNSGSTQLTLRTTSTDNSLPFLCKDKEVSVHSHLETHSHPPPPPSTSANPHFSLSTFTTRQLPLKTLGLLPWMKSKSLFKGLVSHRVDRATR